MSFTEFDARLQGAKRAAVWPTVGGADVLALLIASPTTGHVLLADLMARVVPSPSLYLSGLAPRSIAVDGVREEGWIYCDTGWLVRCGVAIVDEHPTLVEQARAQVGELGFAPWAVIAQGLPTTGRRIAAGRAVEAAPRLGGTSARLIETVAVGTPRIRLIDVGSQRVIILPVAEGTIAAFATEAVGIVELSRMAGLPPGVEAGVYDPDSGYLYLVDSGGAGAIIELLPDNSLRAAATFQFPNVQGPVSAQVITSKLYVCTERRNRVLCWDLAVPEAPVLESDTTYDSGLYWEQNPVRFVNNENLSTVRKFGSLPNLLTHADYPVEEAGLSDLGGGVAFAWALHGEIGALTYTLPLEPAAYEDTTSTIFDNLTAGVADPPYNYVRAARPAGPNPTFTFTMPGATGVAYEIRLRIRGRIEGKIYTKGTAAEIDAFGADELAAGYDARQAQVEPRPNVVWGTWTPEPGLKDNPYITIAAPGQDNYAKMFIAAQGVLGAVSDAYTRVINTVLKLRINGGQTLVLTLDWGGDTNTVSPSKVFATGVDDAFVDADNIALMPPDDDESRPLVIPWAPRFPADPVVFQAHRRHFVQLDITHIQLAPGY